MSCSSSRKSAPRSNPPEAGTLRPPIDCVLLEKDENAVAFYIGEGGNNIMQARAGNVLALPLAFYGGPANLLERAIQERLGALLGAYDAEGTNVPEQPTNGRPEVRIDDVFTHFRERFQSRTLRAVVANDTLAKLLGAVAPADVKVYNAEMSFASDNLVIGLTDPKYVGLIINDPRPRPDDPENDAPGNPPGVRFKEGECCHTGIILHGGLLSATARS